MLHHNAKIGHMHYTERIRALREDGDLTQTQIAQLLKIGQKTYSDYELGRTRIPVDSLILLAKLYDVSMDYICGVCNQRTPFPKKLAAGLLQNSPYFMSTNSNLSNSL